MTRLSLNSKIKNPLSTLWGERARVRGDYEKISGVYLPAIVHLRLTQARRAGPRPIGA
jgi:hypothetical protein